MKEIVLKQGNNMLAFYDFNYFKEDDKSGNPYNTQFYIKVISGPFSGITEFQMDIKQCKKFIENLNELYDLKVSVVSLNDISYGSSIKFELKKTGQIEVSGIIYGSDIIHSMTFSFQIDPLLLKKWIKDLKEVIPA